MGGIVSMSRTLSSRQLVSAHLCGCWSHIGTRSFRNLPNNISTSNIVLNANAADYNNSRGTTSLKAKSCTIEYHTVPGDDSFPEAAQKLLQDAGAPVTIYDGMEHGFAVRGDFAGNAALKKAADDCLEAVVRQFARAATA